MLALWLCKNTQWSSENSWVGYIWQYTYILLNLDKEFCHQSFSLMRLAFKITLLKYIYTRCSSDGEFFNFKILRLCNVLNKKIELPFTYENLIVGHNYAKYNIEKSFCAKVLTSSISGAYLWSVDDGGIRPSP